MAIYYGPKLVSALNIHEADITFLDKTLTEENYAADAKVVGDRFDTVESSVEANTSQITGLSDAMAMIAPGIECGAAGSHIVLPDSSDKPFVVMELVGKAEQFTTTGKNLLPYPYDETRKTMNGITYTDNGDGSITAIGTSTGYSAFYLNKKFIVDGQHILSIISDNDQFLAKVEMYDSSDTLIESYESSTSESFNLTGLEAGSYAVLSAKRNSAYSEFNSTFYAQVELGNVFTKYEPYTGGIASPNPKYPQEIEIAGLEKWSGAQLLDIDSIKSRNINGVVFTNNGDGTRSITGTTGESYAIDNEIVLNLEPGVYFISHEKLEGGSTDVEVYLRITTDGVDQYFSNKVIEITGNETKVCFYIQVAPNKTVDTKLRVMLNKGSESLPWEPYTGGVPAVNLAESKIDVGVTGKNVYLTETREFSIRWIGDSFLPIDIGDYYLDKSKPYTISFVSNKSFNAFFIGEQSNVTIVSGKNTFVATQIDKVNDYGSLFYSREPNLVDGIIFSEIQLEPGSVATPYEPYTSQTITIATPEGLAAIPVSSGHSENLFSKNLLTDYSAYAIIWLQCYCTYSKPNSI